MTNCELCQQQDPAIPVQCYFCGECFHLHQAQVRKVGQGDVILASCPKCHAANCWLKSGDGIVGCGVVIYAGQRVVDLRRQI